MSDHLPSLGDSAEHIAFRLLEMIIARDAPKAPQNMNATWILTTYGRCLRTVRNPEAQLSKAAAAPARQP